GLRGDGSSGFGSNFRTALYPKVSASWVVSQEPFLRNVSSWLGSLRLRAALGSSGVQPGPTTKISQLSVLNGFVDGQVQNGAYLITLANPNLKAERETEFEGGLDAELWHRRVTLEATYYTRHSSDALIDVQLPQSVGIYTEEQNVGSIRNRGLEGAINVQVLSWRDAILDLGVSGSTNHSRVLALAPGVSKLATLAGFYPVESRVGYSMDGVWTRPLLGYRDLNGDGIIAPNEITVGDSAGPGGPLAGLPLCGADADRAQSRVVDENRRHRPRAPVHGQPGDAGLQRVRHLRILRRGHRADHALLDRACQSGTLIMTATASN